MNTMNAGKAIFQRLSLVIFLVACGFAAAFGQIDPRLGPLAKPDPNKDVKFICSSASAKPEYKKLVDYMLGGDPQHLRAAFTIIKATVGNGEVPEAEAISNCYYSKDKFERCRTLTYDGFPSWDVIDGVITTTDGLKFKMTSIGNHAWTGILQKDKTTWILTAVLYRATGVIEDTQLLD